MKAATACASTGPAANMTLQHLFAMFNNKLADFLDDLRPVIGGLPEYGLLTSSVALMSHLDPSQNHRLFSRYVTKTYRTYIVNHDEAFFLCSNGSDFGDLSTVQGVQSSTADIVALLKGAWAGLAEADRQAVWAHLDVLVRVTDMIEAKASGKAEGRP